MKTIEEKFKKVTISEKFIQKYGFELSTSEELVAVFESGYNLAQKDMQLPVEKALSDLTKAQMDCHKHVKELEEQLKEAREVIRVQNEIIKKIGIKFEQNKLCELVNSEDIRNRFFKFVNASSDCHEWTGSISSNGYGQFSIGNRPYLAHRVACAIHRIDFYDFMVVDHTFMNKKCVNPAHLRLVTDGLNAIENSNSISNKNSLKTHCVNGHPLSGENLYLKSYAGGTRKHRQCKICTKKWKVQNKEKKSRAYLEKWKLKIKPS